MAIPRCRHDRTLRTPLRRGCCGARDHQAKSREVVAEKGKQQIEQLQLKNATVANEVAQARAKG